MKINKEVNKLSVELYPLEKRFQLFQLQKNFQQKFNPVYYAVCLIAGLSGLLLSFLTLIHL
jgi:hypothetical protein